MNPRACPGPPRILSTVSRALAAVPKLLAMSLCHWLRTPCLLVAIRVPSAKYHNNSAKYLVAANGSLAAGCVINCDIWVLDSSIFLLFLDDCNVAIALPIGRCTCAVAKINISLCESQYVAIPY